MNGRIFSLFFLLQDFYLKKIYSAGVGRLGINKSLTRYHYKCLKIARGKVKEDDKYTCPICDWRMKIPRDAARPKLEDLVALFEEITSLPFQPEEEEVLSRIIDNAQTFRDHIARYCNPLLSTEAEAETQRFYLRKLEGAEVLLAYETNFFRQELHKWCPVALEPPPILEVSLSTRKPRPTKLQKMLAEYGVDDPDDLPEHAKGKANSLRRKAANAEAAAAAAAAHASSPGVIKPPSNSAAYGGSAFFVRGPQQGPTKATSPKISLGACTGLELRRQEGRRMSGEEMDSGLQAGLLGSGSPQVLVDHSSMSLEERLLQGREEGINLQTEAGKSKALEILGRTETGKRQAEKIWGPDIWGSSRSSLSGPGRAMASEEMEDGSRHDDGKVAEMFKEMTNEDDDDGKRGDGAVNGTVTAETLESERNGLDALLDGE